MKLLKLLLAGSATGVIAAAFRDFDNQRWLAPAGRAPSGSAATEAEAAEPVLGYDGMDTDMLADWLPNAELDAATLRRVRSYEAARRSREPVLAVIDDLLDRASRVPPERGG